MSVVYAGMILPEFGMCRNQNKPATISCSAAISGGNILKTTNKTMIEKKIQIIVGSVPNSESVAPC